MRAPRRSLVSRADLAWVQGDAQRQEEVAAALGFQPPRTRGERAVTFTSESQTSKPGDEQKAEIEPLLGLAALVELLDGLKDRLLDLHLDQLAFFLHHDDQIEALGLQVPLQRFEALLPEVPYIGGDENRYTRNLCLTAAMLALYRSLQSRGATVEEAARVIALRAPTAIDLRVILSVMRMSANLERIGDLAKNADLSKFIL